MTTPGSVRTKIWRSGNKKRYSDYQREYMRKYREKQKGTNATPSEDCDGSGTTEGAGVGALPVALRDNTKPDD